MFLKRKCSFRPRLFFCAKAHRNKLARARINKGRFACWPRGSNGRRAGRWLEVGGAVAEDFAAGKFFDAPDLRGDEQRRFAGRKRRSNFDGRVDGIFLAAVKTEAAFRNVFTFDDIVRVCRMANACAEIYADAHVAPAVGRASIRIHRTRSSGFRFFRALEGNCNCRRRHV